MTKCTIQTAPLDQGMVAFAAEIARATPPGFVTWPLPRQREAWDAVCRSFRAPRPAGLDVYDIAIDGPGGPLPLRLYRPVTGGLRAGVPYFHGGGWVLGSLDSHDDMCAEIATGADVVVIAVDYRLAPEHRHPAQFEDMLATWAWLQREGRRHGVDPDRLIGAGDSAGGQMTAALAMHLRDHRLPQLLAQVLIYPVLGIDLGTGSYAANADATSLSRAEMQFYLDAFLGPPDSPAWRDKRAAPLLETDYSQLPPAFVTAAAHDPLHDDAVLYVERLTAAGVPATLRREPALGHSYMRARHVSAPARAGFDAIVAAIGGFAGTQP